MHRRRFFAFVTASAVLFVLGAAPAMGAPAGGKGITLSAANLTGLGSIAVSGGQAVPFSITVTNTSNATRNDVHLLVGQDDNPTTAANGDTTMPVPLPDGVTAAAAGCSSGAVLDCSIGSLRAKKSVTITVTLSTAEVTSAIPSFRTKAAAITSEGTNDNGSNQDSFSLEGTLAVGAFSCESVTVYKPGADKTASTCSVTDTRNGNGQSASVVLPSRLQTATVRELSLACPPVAGLTCIGDVVEADIAGDTTSDVVRWTFSLAVSGSVNLNKLVVYHYNDAGTLTEIIELRRNGCRNATAVGCGSATLSDGILTITVQTAGNGRVRGFG